MTKYEPTDGVDIDGIASVGGAAKQTADLTLERVLGILWRNKGLIFGVTLAGMIAATLIGLQILPKYTAKALVMIEPREANVVGFRAVLSGLPADPATVETEIKILSSRDHMQQVVEELGLAEAEFGPPKAETNLDLGFLIGKLRQQLDVWLPASYSEEPVPRLEAARPPSANAALSRLDKGLKITQEGHSYVIGVSFTSTSPATAAAVANAVAKIHVQKQLERKRTATANAVDWLGERVAAIRGEVARAEAEVEQYRAVNKLVDERRTDVTEQQVADINKELLAAQADQAGRETRLAFIRELRRRGNSLDTLPEVLSSLVIIELRRQEAELSRREAELATTLGEKHPMMKLIVAERQKLAGKIAREIDRIVANLENEVQIAAARVGSIQTGLARVQQMSTQAQTAEVRLHELEREAQVSRQLYESLLQRYKETKEQQTIVEPDARVISTAVPPERPSSPSPLLFATMGLTVSMLMGAMLAFLRDHFDKGLRSDSDVHAALGLDRIALVPRLNRLGHGQRPHHYLLRRPLSAYAEAIRAILTTLHLDNGGRPAKLILVTSSVPGEGKTTLAVSLATYAASAGHRVLLLDLDLRQPSVLRELCRPVTAGIVEHLLHDIPLEEVIDHHPELMGLDVIAVCKRLVDPMPLMVSRQMDEILQRLRDRYDYVIVDSPPLLGVTDAQLLSPLVDKVLVVVRWSKTARLLAQSTARLLRAAGADIAGVVITQANIKRHASYGYGDVGDFYHKYSFYYRN